jgi:pyrroline-5-carboxylate reductase
MPRLHHKIGFIGAGNMGQAMIGALITSQCANPSSLFVSDVSQDRVADLSKAYGVIALPGNVEIIQTSDIIIFAVKPQALDKVLADLSAAHAFKNAAGKKCFISIAAGAPIRKFEKIIYEGMDAEGRKNLPILRVMPNTPALVLSGMSGLCGNAFATAEDMDIATIILSAMGKVIRCNESDMDAITAMSGSGPAYCFYVVEAMIDAGTRLGLSPEDAAELTLATFKGALALLEDQKIPPQALRQKVTSPGGTTEAAIAVLENRSVKQAFIDAIAAAARRSEELSK